MKKLSTLLAKRNNFVSQMNNITTKISNSPGYGLKAQLKKYHNAKETIIAKLDAEIKSTERHINSHEYKNLHAIHAKWLRSGDKHLNADEISIIRNALSTSTGSGGGYTVKTEIAESIVEALKSYGGMRSVTTVINTESGNEMAFPTTDGTAEEGELIPENQSVTDLDIVFGTVAINPYKFSSKVVTVPIELLQDSQIDIEEFVNNRLVERVGRITNKLFTIGTGTNQPHGIVTSASAGKIGATGQTNSILFDDLVDLVHSVDIAYRNNSGFMLNDGTLKEIEKIKDDTGRPIFIPGNEGLGNTMPSTVLGYPVTINNDMSVMTANAKSILFGDFKKYIIRDVVSASLHRFDDSAYAKLGQVGFLMWTRSGGNLTDNQAIKYYQNSAI